MAMLTIQHKFVHSFYVLFQRMIIRILTDERQTAASK
jgi:hypothetical protein